MGNLGTRFVFFQHIGVPSLPPSTLGFSQRDGPYKIILLSGQTEQQTKVLTGGHRLLSEYFQSCDSKQISCPGSVLLQETNLLPRFSGQAGDEYHGNQPNIMVIRRIFW